MTDAEREALGRLIEAAKKLSEGPTEDGEEDDAATG